MTTGETGKAGQGDPQTTGKTSTGGEGTTSPNPAKTHTDAEAEAKVSKAVSDALAKAGRERKAIEEENATLKTRISSFDLNIKEIQDDRAKLRETLDDLAKDDPDKKRLTEKLKTLGEQEKALKLDRARLDAERAEHAETIKIATETRMETAVSKIVADYQNGDAAKLLSAVKRYGITTAEDVRALADTFWTKVAPAANPNPPITPDSGVNVGGEGELTAERMDKMSVEELANHPAMKRLYGRK